MNNETIYNAHFFKKSMFERFNKKQELNTIVLNQYEKKNYFSSLF